MSEKNESPTGTKPRLSCPFCGSASLFTEPDEWGSGGQWVSPIHVGCKECKAEQSADTEEEAVKRWNRRSSPTPSAPGDAQDERQTDACPRCEGSGEITVMSDNSPDAHDVVVCCDHCQGSGAAVDAAKYLAAALAGEKYRHMQLWAEYRNFHRRLCARFGYGHDEVHFRRDLVSLEEAIAAMRPAPAAGDALDAARYRQLRKALTSFDTGWLDRIATALEAMGLDPDEDKLPTPEQVDGAFDAAQRKGDA